jgi:hypothetical protein
MRRSPSSSHGSSPSALSLAVALVLGVGACGDLDDVSTVKDLRVLAVKTEPAGFLVPLDDPGSIGDTTATLTALVVDPLGAMQTLNVSGVGCPDYIDTITSASGKGSKLCPSKATTDALPAPLNTLIASEPLPASTAMPAPPSTIEYDPPVSFGLSAEKVGIFFTKPAAGATDPFSLALSYNRDFGLDAIVNLDFTLGAEKASAIKRVVYWPRLAPDQLANQNPKLADLQFFKRRNDTTGDPENPWPATTPTLSQTNLDQLYVNPVPEAGAAEIYLLNVRNADTHQVERRTPDPKELLTYQFYATAGTFSPTDRRSELSPIFTSPDGRVHVDSQYKFPKEKDWPASGEVTIWVVVRDERTGTWWSSRTINIVR